MAQEDNARDQAHVTPTQDLVHILMWAMVLDVTMAMLVLQLTCANLVFVLEPSQRIALLYLFATSHLLATQLLANASLSWQLMDLIVMTTTLALFLLVA